MVTAFKFMFEFFVENDVCLYVNDDGYDDMPKEDEEFWKEVDLEETRKLDYKKSSIWHPKLLSFQTSLLEEGDFNGY